MQLDYTHRRLSAVSENYLGRKREAFVRLTAKLDAMSPLKVLSRGYSMTRNAEGKVIKSIGDVAVGDELIVTLTDGKMRTEVLEVSQ